MRLSALVLLCLAALALPASAEPQLSDDTINVSGSPNSGVVLADSSRQLPPQKVAQAGTTQVNTRSPGAPTLRQNGFRMPWQTGIYQ